MTRDTLIFVLIFSLIVVAMFALIFFGVLEMAKGRPGKAVANERSHPFIIEVSVARQWIRPRIEP